MILAYMLLFSILEFLEFFKFKLLESGMSFNSLAICLNENSKSKQPLIGLATLMALIFAEEDLTQIGSQLLELAGTGDAEALLDLSTLIQLKGDHDTGVALQQQALLLKQQFILEPENINSQLKLLAIMAPGDLMSNTPLEFITEAIGINLQILYVSTEYPLPDELPEHDIIMVAVSELDRNYSILKILEVEMAHWNEPVINKPQHIIAMARDRTSLMLQNIQGITMPITHRVARSDVNTMITDDDISNISFPIIIRPVDSHAGLGLQKLDSIENINSYLQSQSTEHYFVSPYVNYASKDNMYRKYRIILINGQPFIVHMAISDSWMVHYASAGMQDDISKRCEEQHVMETFNECFATRHATAFKAIYERIGLNYIGIDCSETPQGELLIFEIGNALAVHTLDSSDMFSYKKIHINKIFSAFEQLLINTINCAASNKSLELIKM